MFVCSTQKTLAVPLSTSIVNYVQNIAVIVKKTWFDTYYNQWLPVHHEYGNAHYQDINNYRQKIRAFSLSNVHVNLHYQFLKMHVANVKQYYPSLMSEKQIEFSTVTENGKSYSGDYDQCVLIDHTKLKLRQETVISENACPTCRNDCRLYKCARVYT